MKVSSLERYFLFRIQRIGHWDVPGEDRGSTGGKPAVNRYLRVPPYGAETEIVPETDFDRDIRRFFADTPRLTHVRYCDLQLSHTDPSQGDARADFAGRPELSRFIHAHVRTTDDLRRPVAAIWGVWGK